MEVDVVAGRERARGHRRVAGPPELLGAPALDPLHLGLVGDAYVCRGHSGVLSPHLRRVRQTVAAGFGPEPPEGAGFTESLLHVARVPAPTSSRPRRRVCGAPDPAPGDPRLP